MLITKDQVGTELFKGKYIFCNTGLYKKLVAAYKELSDIESRVALIRGMRGILSFNSPTDYLLYSAPKKKGSVKRVAKTASDIQL